MIKKLLSIALVSTSILANAQSFTATYSFASTTSLTGTTDPSTPPSVAGITCGTFQAVGTGTTINNAGRFSFSGWPLATLSGTTSAASYTAMGGTIDLGKYYEVTLTPNANSQLTLNSMNFVARRTSTSARSFAVRSSIDSYAANLTATVVGTGTIITIAGINEFFFSVDGNTNYFNGNTITFDGAFTNLTNPVTIRFYAWNGESTATNSSFAIDDVTFIGSTSITTGLGTITSDLNSNFNMYPVPNNDGVVYINNKNNVEISNIEVIDMLGNIVSTTTENKTALNLANVSNGTYFVRIYANNSVTTQKIVINK